MGMNRILLKAKYESPCIVFDDSYLYNYNATELKNWCMKEFNTDFTDSLLSFCKTPNESFNDEAIAREKRVALAIVGIIGIITVVVSTTIGFLSKAVVGSESNRKSLDQVIQIQRAQLERLAQLKNNDKKI